MKAFKIVVLVLVLVALGIQAVRPAKTNPPVDSSATIYAQMEIPAEVAAVLRRSCHDCHSNDTRWPWYSNVAPVSWMVINHVNEGCEHMNLSEWAQYDREARVEHLEKMCKEVSQGGMPIPAYLWMHEDAKLTKQDVRALCDWSAAARQKLGQAEKK